MCRVATGQSQAPGKWFVGLLPRSFLKRQRGGGVGSEHRHGLTTVRLGVAKRRLIHLSVFAADWLEQVLLEINGSSGTEENDWRRFKPPRARSGAR